MKVGVFLNTVSSNKTNKKRDILLSFAEGVKKNREKIKIIEHSGYEPCNVAVIFGFYGNNLGSTQKTRKLIYKEHTKKGRKCIFIDADPLKNAGRNPVSKETGSNHFFRISYNSIFPNQAMYFNENSPGDRWDKISSAKKLQLKPWRKSGEHILICMNSDSKTGRGWSAGNIDTDIWLSKTIDNLRKFTSRPILVRYHPGGGEEVHKRRRWKEFVDFKDVCFSGGIIANSSLVRSGTSLQEDCQDAWACVALTSSASVIPLVEGIPVFTDNSRCLAYPLANKHLSEIDNPLTFDREQWFHNLAYSCWNCNEMKSGEVWKRISSNLDPTGNYIRRKRV